MNIKKYALVIGLILLIALFSLFKWKNRGAPFYNQEEGESAVHSLVLSVDSNEQQTFLSMIKEYANQNSFAFRLSHTQLKPHYFMVLLWRDDLKIIGTPTEENEIRVLFFRNSGIPLDYSDKAAKKSLDELRELFHTFL